MSISFTGMASGLPVNDIIEQLMAIESQSMYMLEDKKTKLEASKTYVDNIETRTKSLGTAIQKFTDGNITDGLDLFKKKEATSSNESALTIAAGNKAVNQTFTVNILNIATSTKVQSLGSGVPNGAVGNEVDGTTLVSALSNGAGTGGTFTVFYNDTPTEITINATDTVNQVLTNITTNVPGITASIAGGIVTLASAGGTINVGANGDTSNFLSATQLDIGTYVGNNLLSANSLSAISTEATLTDNSVNMQTAVTAGTVTIGKANFTIDATTTMDDLLNDINASTEAGVSATYNLRTNKIEFFSKEPGQTAITLGAAGDTSNFLQAINLVNGADTLAYQDLGTNAEIQINGGPVIESTSNTVTDAVTGIKDVTLTLLDDSGGSDITATVKQDTDAIVSAVEQFVTDFNNLLNYIDQETKPDTGHLPSDSSLIRFRNNLRMQVTDIVANSPLYSLASIGITTGDVGSEGDASSKLKFDKSKFLDALETNQEDVRALFIGDSTASITGVMAELEVFTDAALDPVNGFFFTRDEAISNQIDDIEKSIIRMQERLEAKEELLKAQFSAMEQAISTLNSQQSYISGQLTKTK
ncbi:MAG: flagellar filament capping protein FliD [Cyanobacteriota bacterium]